MKIIQAGVLVLVGILGAMMYMKSKGGPETPPPVAQVAPVPEAPIASTTPSTPVPVAEPAPAPAAPVKPEKKRTAVASRRAPEQIAHAPSSPPVVPTPQAAPTPPAPAPTPATVTESAPRAIEIPQPPPPPPPARKVTVTAGTLLPVRLIETISSDRNHPGDTFTASLEEPLVIDGFVIAEKGARVEGRIVDTRQAGRVQGLASIALELTRLATSDGQNVEIATDSFTQAGPESKGADAAKIGGAAAIGAAIGAIAGGGKGAAIGAGVGGAAGTGGVLATRGKPAVLPSETKLSFRLSNSVTITEKRRRG